jgi:hypothetical protein
MSDRAAMPANYDDDLSREYDSEPLIDPDCTAGKHVSCVGGICECDCHEDDAG